MRREDDHIWKQRCLNVFLEKFLDFLGGLAFWVTRGVDVSETLGFQVFSSPHPCWMGHWWHGLLSQLLKPTSAANSLTQIPLPCLTMSLESVGDLCQPALCKANWPSRVWWLYTSSLCPEITHCPKHTRKKQPWMWKEKKLFPYPSFLFCNL